MTPRHADVLVVGGGLIGATTAFALRQAGHAVTVLDANLPGAAWRAAAGLLSLAAEGLTSDTPLGALAAESLRLWPAFARQLETSSGVCVHYREGVLTRQLEGTWTGTPGEGQVHPPSVVRAALHGLPVHAGRVLAVQALPEGVQLTTDQGPWYARTVILAAGAWSATFGLPVTPVQGQALLFTSPDSAAAPTRAAGRRRGQGARAYTLTRPDGVYVGATVRRNTQGTADVHARRWLQAAAGHLDPRLRNQPVQTTLLGLRPVTPDGHPIVGPHPSQPGVLVATGHGRHGALLAPWTARRILDLLPAPVPAGAA